MIVSTYCSVWVYVSPIAILDKDQELGFVAIAKMGKGIKHAKFSPGLIYYRYVEDVDSEEIKKDDETFKKMVEEAERKENKELVMTVESWGQISAKDIFNKAVDSLNKNLKEFVKSIK